MRSTEPVIPILPVEQARLPRSGVLSFGYQRTPTHRHQGIDLPARLGIPVRACIGGVVQHATTTLTAGFSGYGRVIVVRSDPEQTPDGLAPVWCLYAHLEDVHVRSGQRVGAGHVIGSVGNTCFHRDDPERRCSGPHLHFEVSPRPYPQASEAPRLDPVGFLTQHRGMSRSTVAGAFLLLVAAVLWAWERMR